MNGLTVAFLGAAVIFVVINEVACVRTRPLIVVVVVVVIVVVRRNLLVRAYVKSSKRTIKYPSGIFLVLLMAKG
jgi:hypothetical protein